MGRAVINKQITVTIEHNLTPFHEESMKGMLDATIKALESFWQNKSTKEFKVTVEEK